LGKETHVIATGGLGPMIGTGSKFIKNVDDFLTLEGLRTIWERNAGARKDSASPKPAPNPSSKPANKAKNGDSSTPARSAR